MSELKHIFSRFHVSGTNQRLISARLSRPDSLRGEGSPSGKAPVVARVALGLVAALFVLAAGTLPCPAGAIVGPIFPPLGGVGFFPNGGEAALSGGVYWTFTGAGLAARDTMYWGPTASPNNSNVPAVMFSLVGNLTDFMSYNSTSGNTIIFTGSSGGIPTRCLFGINNASMALNGNVGLNPALGAVAVVPGTGSWSVNIVVEVYLNGSWIPGLAAFDILHRADPGNYPRANTEINCGFYYVNSAPTISPIADMVVTPGILYGPIPIILDDWETPGTLQVTATSDNGTVLPSSYIQLVASGPSHYFYFRCPAGHTGVGHAILNVTDQDGGTNSTSFKVTMGTAPTISDFASQVVQMNQSSAPIPFTIGDAETPAGNLILTPLSGNPSLVPLGNLVIGGSGASRTLTVSGAPNAAGSTTVGVQVSDGIFTNQSTFNLLINIPPTISGLGGNYAVQPGGSVGAIPLSVGDADASANLLTLQAFSDNPAVVDPNQVLFTGIGAFRNLYLNTVAGGVGVAHVKVVVADANGGTSFGAITVTADYPPNLSAIPTQTIQMNSTSGPISFTLSDALIAPDSLLVTPVYGDLNLVPQGNITISGSGTNRTLRVAGAPNKYGVTFIGVLAYNGYFSTQSVFQLTINSPPTITPPGTNYVVTPGSANGPYPFTIDDVETPGALNLQAFSDNPAVLPADRVNFSVVGANHVIYFYPLAGTNGIAHITLVVTDVNGGTNATSFTVTSDFAPFISAIPDQIVQMNTTSGPISFAIGSAVSPADSLAISLGTSNPLLLPLSSLTRGGSGSNRTLTIAPPAGQSGSATISVQVSDGILTTQTNFSLKINHAPALLANMPLIVNQGGTATIIPANLTALDPDNSPAEIRFTINPQGTGGSPSAGTLLKSGLPLLTGSIFTMDDIQNGLVTYQHGGSCGATDGFPFSVTDASGGVAVNSGNLAYNFQIQVQPVDIAPVAKNASFSVANGASFNGSLTASNGDCRNSVLTYQVVTPPAKGILTGFNAANGAFTYLSTSTQPGTDSFTFLVANSGVTAGATSVVPGTVTITLTNASPKLTFNVLLPVNQCATAVITPAYLTAVDPDNSPDQIIFTVSPGGQGGPPHNGTLLNNGNALGSGATFTMADVNNGRVAYHNNCGCDTNDDFAIGVTDTAGGQANDNGHTSFSFRIRITPVDVPPVANNSSLAVPLGANATGTLTAANPDCRNTSLRFLIATPPTKGTITALNSTNGTYTYQATPGQTGADSFTFLVANYGVSAGSTSLVPGTVAVMIQNTPPTASSTNFLVTENLAFTNSLPGTDPDQPAQPLTFTLTANGSKGTATLLDASTGEFVYTPLSNRFGFDSLTFQVSDGIVTSAPATVTINIRVNTLQFGYLVLSEDSLPAIIAFNPASGDAGIVSLGAPMSNPSFLAVEPAGTIVVADQDTGLNRIDPGTGTGTNLVAGSQLRFGLGVALESTGNILASAAGGGKISRFSPDGTLLTNFSTEHMSVPAGLAVDSTGLIYCANAGFFGGGTNAVLQIDPLQLQEVGLAGMTSVVGLTVDPENTLVAADFLGNALVRVFFPGGTTSPISTGGKLNQPFGVASDSHGYLYAVNGGDGALVGVDPVTGDQTLLAPPGAVGHPFGITVAGWPIVPPVITSAQFTSTGSFAVTITGFPGTPYTLLSSPDLNAPASSWTVVGPFTQTAPGTFVATDPGAGGAAQRYYRARY